jgi:putative FmdB family regulatory protein
MPIYAYRCASCGHTKDVLQKLSDAPLTVCPACSAEAFSRQVSAPAFQLKGSGWYVTDFRDNGKKADAGSGSDDAGGGTAKTADAPAPAPAADSAAKTGAGTAPSDSGSAKASGSDGAKAA